MICDVPFGRQYGTIEGCRDGLYKVGTSVSVGLCATTACEFPNLESNLEAVLKEFDRVQNPDLQPAALFTIGAL